METEHIRLFIRHNKTSLIYKSGVQTEENMFYLILAIICSSSVSVIMRLHENHMKNQMAMFAANYATCAFLGALFIDWTAGDGGSQDGAVGLLHTVLGSEAETALLLSVIQGATFLGGFLFLKINMIHNGIVLSTTFKQLGVIIPTLMAIVAFGETLGLLQAAGIALALTGIILIQYEKGSLGEGGGMKKKYLLLVLILAGGINDSMMNIYDKIIGAEGKDGYLMVAFFISGLLSLALALREGKHPGKADLLYGLAIGVPNYFAGRGLLYALETVDAVLVYPMFNVGTLVTVTIIGIVFFREQISRKKILTVGIIIAAICLLNM